jgi:hypothetical protein
MNVTRPQAKKKGAAEAAPRRICQVARYYAPRFWKSNQSAAPTRMNAKIQSREHKRRQRNMPSAAKQHRRVTPAGAFDRC